MSLPCLQHIGIMRLRSYSPRPLKRVLALSTAHTADYTTSVAAICDTRRLNCVQRVRA